MAHRLSASPISAHTKGEVRRLRLQGFVPVSVQRRGEPTVHLQTDMRVLDEFIRQHGATTVIELDVEPEHKLHSVLLHDLQRDAVTRRLLHVTLQRVVKGEKLKTHVPILFVGEPESVGLHAAILQHQAEQVEIRCLPTNIPEHIVVDVSSMIFGEPMRVSDIPASDVYEILTAPETVLASLSSMAVQPEEEVEVEELQETATPEDSPA